MSLALAYIAQGETQTHQTHQSWSAHRESKAEPREIWVTWALEEQKQAETLWYTSWGSRVYERNMIL